MLDSKEKNKNNQDIEVNREDLEGAYKKYSQFKIKNGIVTKGLNDYLKEDSTLREKITYDQFKMTKSGIDDSKLEEAYKKYSQFKIENGIVTKGLNDYLEEDSTLKKKIKK